MSKFEAVIFDMDGTLLDSEAFAFKVWHRAFREFGFDLSREIFISMIGTSAQATDQTLGDIYGPSLPIMEVRMRKVQIELETLLTEKIEKRKGVSDLIDHLSNSNIPFGLATSTERVRAVARLKSADLLTKFEFVIFGDEVKMQKPDPEIYLTMAEMLGVDIKSTLIIEDSTSGIQGALNSGATVYWYKDMADISEELKLRVRSISSMSEVLVDF